MTVLLTGSTGFLGTWIAKDLESRKVQWRALKVRLHQLGPAELEGVSTVIHCAGQTPRSGIRDEAFFEINAMGTRHLLEQCERARVKRLIYVSSMGVKFPSSLYAQSKLAAEESVKRCGLEWLILRPAHAYGPNEELLHLFRKLRRKRIVSVLGFGRSPMHIIYVKDCAAAIVDAALSSRSGEILNIIAPDVSELEYYRVLRKVIGAKYLIVPRSLRWARKRKGNRWIELQTTGLRIPGMPDWEFVATPLNVAMKESYLAVEST